MPERPKPAPEHLLPNKDTQVEDRDSTEVTAADTRNRRVDFLREKMEALFEGERNKELRAEIEQSFLVPQWGEYHNEGTLMDSHLKLIFDNIDAVERGEFAEGLSEQTRAALSRAVEHDREAVEKYVFLHDISKKDTLTLKFDSPEAAQAAGLTDAEGKDVAVTWEQYQALLAQHADGALALQGDEEAMGRWSKNIGLKAVGYFQPERKHGDVGSEALQSMGVDVDTTTLVAIERHEDAFSYQFVDPDRYLRNYHDIDNEGRDMALLASYVDTMGSLGRDGNPQLQNFELLAASKEKLEQVRRFLEKLGAEPKQVDAAFGGYVTNRREERNHARKPLIDLFKKLAKENGLTAKSAQALEKLMFNKEELRAEDLEDTLAEFKEQYAMPSYDRGALLEGLQEIIDERFTAEDAEALADMALDNPDMIGKNFGRKLGRNMRTLQGILKAAQK